MSVGKGEGSNNVTGRLRAQRMLSTGADAPASAPFPGEAHACVEQEPNEDPPQSLELVQSRSQAGSCS